MVALLKVIIIVMAMVFVDLIVQQITGGDYGIIAVAILLIRVILAFLVIVVHALTHWDDISNDLVLILTGFISLLVWIGNSLVNVLFDLWGLLPEIIFGFLDTVGIGSMIKAELAVPGTEGLPIPTLGFLIDFRTITFQVSFGGIVDWSFMELVNFSLDNTIGFSFFGIGDEARLFLGIDLTGVKAGELVPTYVSQGQLGVVLNLVDEVYVMLPDPVAVTAYWFCKGEQIFNPTKVCNYPPDLKYALGLNFPFNMNFVDAIYGLLASVPVPSLGEWVDQVFDQLIPGISLTNIQMIIQLKLEELYFKCQNVKQLSNMVSI